jgi:hypothetical protein
MKVTPKLSAAGTGISISAACPAASVNSFAKSGRESSAAKSPDCVADGSAAVPRAERNVMLGSARCGWHRGPVRVGVIQGARC